MKVLGMVNKYNRGIAKANKELEKNGNPKANFDVNKRTEFRVTIMTREKSGQINSESGQINFESGQIKSGTINNDKCGDIGDNGCKNADIGVPEYGAKKSGQINSESGQINNAKPYDTESQDFAVLKIIENRPGIKVEAIFLEIKTSTRSVRRVLERLAKKDKIEYRGSKRTGGWFVKT